VLRGVNCLAESRIRNKDGDQSYKKMVDDL
jgi:hypothetical protein